MSGHAWLIFFYYFTAFWTAVVLFFYATRTARKILFMSWLDRAHRLGIFIVYLAIFQGMIEIASRGIAFSPRLITVSVGIFISCLTLWGLEIPWVRWAWNTSWRRVFEKVGLR